ncbi:MAG TPA: 50S ribosomal protein L25 [Candidatus Omnitrophota bacterium]|nr:50S ribosomal protein L25 [Candidatus Omnitrophota bacterium]
MEEIKLDVQIRNEVGSRVIRSVRRENFIPAVVYGGAQKSPTVIKIDKRVYEKFMRAHRGQSVLFHLNIMEGEKKLRDYSAILRDEQHHPVHDHLLHLDFQRINLKEEIEVKVPIMPKGDAPGVKKQGGSLDQPLHDLDIVCLPMDIPDKINVDVSHLSIGDAVHVGDLKLPQGVRTKHDPLAMVLSIVPPMKEEIEVPAEQQITEPEVLKEKKPKPGEEAVAGAEAPAKAEKAEKKEEKKKEEKK